MEIPLSKFKKESKNEVVKYWLLTTEYPPNYGGGIGTYCYLWSSLLRQDGHEVSVFMPDNAISDYRVDHHDGIRFIRFAPYFNNTSSFLGYETMISNSFASILEVFLHEEGCPEWVEAQEYNGIAYFILQKKHLGYPAFKNLQVLITCHCPSFITFQHNHVNTFKLPYFWIGEMERFCIKAADVCISPSQYLSDYLHQHLTLDKQIHVLHNPYKVQEQKDEKRQLENKAVFIGKLSPAKGILQTLRSFQQLWAEGYTTKLQLVGDEYYYYHALHVMMGKHIRSQFARYIDQGLLQISGILPPQKVAEAVQAARVVLLPSTVENFPYTIVECMAAGKVVLSSMQGGQKEIIVDGHNGFLFDHAEPASFANKLKQVLALSQDELIRIGTSAIQTVKEGCDPNRYLAAKLELLQRQAASSAEIFPFVHHISMEKGPYRDHTQGLLSIVIPFYNLGRLLVETVDSVMAASYPKKEIIIVDDGSTDNESKNVLEELSQREGLKVISQRNCGLAAARNTGALVATGEFLAFLDADDLVDQHYFFKAIEVISSKRNVHFVGAWVQYFGSSEGRWPAFTPEPPYLLFHNMLNSSALVYYRPSFVEGGLNDPAFIFGMEDYDSVVNLVKRGYRGVVLPELLFHYRVRKNSMARGFNKENKSYLYGLLSDKHKEFYASFAAQNVNLLNANGPGYQYDNPTLDYHLFQGHSKYNKVMRKILAIVKKQPRLRRLAITLKNKL